MGRRKAADNDDALVDMLADGSKTYAQIGEALGLSEVHIGKIARGERRPQVLARLRLIRQAMRNEAGRLGARWAGALLRRHIHVGLKGRGETARKCRRFALDRCCFQQEHAWPADSAWDRLAAARLSCVPAGPPQAEDEDLGEKAQRTSPHPDSAESGGAASGRPSRRRRVSDEMYGGCEGIGGDSTARKSPKQ